MHCHVKTWGAIHQKSVKSTSVNSALYVLYNVLGKRRGEVNAMEKLIITACICGAEVTKEHNPAVPYTVEEIAKEAKSAYDAGASIIHLHVREDDGTPTQSKERFEACINAIKEVCPDVIIQPSTGGAVGMSNEERLAPTTLRPEMATLDCGTCNFGGDEIFVNTENMIIDFANTMNEYGIKPEIEEFDKAIEAAKANDEEALLKACHAIEAYFNFPKPNELVKKAEVPGGMYSNMVAQLKQLNSMDILEKAMELIPTVRLAAGLPPLVTPTSQIVGAQAVNCALDLKAGKPMYSNVSNQFVNLVKGEYGKTPVPIDPEFRLKIAGTREEIPYDMSKYQMQPNPTLPEAGGVKLAENEKEVLLLELFPQVAKNFLTRQKEAKYQASHKEEETEKKVVEEKQEEPITGKVVEAPMPGSIFKIR